MRLALEKKAWNGLRETFLGVARLSWVIPLVAGFLTPSVYAVSDEFFDYGKCKNLVSVDDFDAYARRVSEKWKGIEHEYEWRTWIDDPIELKRFMNPVDFDRISSTGAFPLEEYENGLAQYRSVKKANQYLNSIPIGEFEPSVDLLREAHRIIMQDVYSTAEKILYKLGRGLFNIVGPGKFRPIFNIGFPPGPLTDAQLEVIRANPHLRFIKFYRSAAGETHGWIIFKGSPEKRLSELFDWYQQNKGKLSPIQLAAGFQRRFVSIHPFDNGNGRLSRMLMDRILREFSLPPALLRDHDLDLYLTEEDWAREVAAGVAQFQVLAKRAIQQARKTKLADIPPFIGERDHLGYVTLSAKNEKWISPEFFPGGHKARMTAGDGKEYILFKDGFFYSENGVPYVYRQGELFPVPEQNYLLYGMGGRLVSGDLPSGSYRRTVSPQMEEAYVSNLELLARAESGSIAAKDIRVAPYSSILKANKEGRLVLRSWEKAWLRSAIEITDDSPAAILARNRGGFTEFEQAFIRKDNVRISSILAQYQAMDLNYARLEYHFRTADKDRTMVEAIERSRKKLWSAVRHYIDRFEDLAASEMAKHYPDVTDRSALIGSLKASPQFRLFYEYLPYTRAGYPTWEEAVDAISWKKIYLLRNDFKAVRRTGFIPEGAFADLVAAIPGAERFKKYVRARSAKLKDKKGAVLPVSDAAEDAGESAYFAEAPTSSSRSEKGYFDSLIAAMNEKIFPDPYANRGVDEEYERLYVDLHLHATDIGLKRAVSFTVRTDQMVRENGQMAFAGIDGAKFKTYIVEVPVNEAFNNIASGWFRQYEVVVDGYSLPTRIKKSFSEEFFKIESSAPQPIGLEKFVKAGQRIRIE